MRTLLVLTALLGLLGARAPQDVRFTHVDVWLDPGARALDAWQLELVDPTGRAKVVGVEGGDDSAWAEAPYYDPAALQGGRVVLAAFTLEGAPTGRQRVARVHLAVEGGAPVVFETELQAAADAAGAVESVTVEVTE